jgi:hypothetical protein
MMGTQRLSLCKAEAKAALTTYLNEHVFSGSHRVQVSDLKWQENKYPDAEGVSLVLTLDPADEVSAGRTPSSPAQEVAAP